MESKRDLLKYSKDFLNLKFERVQERYRKKKVLEILNKYKPKKILEVGCGSDSLSNYYDGEWVVVEPFCEFAKGVKNAKVIEGFFEEVDIKDEFDFIVISGLLHEVEDVDKFLSKLNQIARNAVIHINVPNAKSFHKLLGVSMGEIDSIYDKTNTHIKLQQNMVFDMDGLVDLLQKHGFRIIDKGGYFIKPFSHSQMQKMLECGIINQKVLDGLYNLKELEEFGSEIYVNVGVSDG